MGTNVVTSFGLYKALKAQGYELPKECVDVELVFPVDGALRIKFLCNVAPEDAIRIGCALTEMGKAGL